MPESDAEVTIISNAELIAKMLQAQAAIEQERSGANFEALGRILNTHMQQAIAIENKAKQIYPGWDRETTAGSLPQEKRNQLLQQAAAALDGAK